ELLDAAALAARVATVPSRSHTLFRCHLFAPRRSAHDLLDLQSGVGLPVPADLLPAPRPLLERNDLPPSSMLDDPGDHAGGLHEGTADLRRLPSDHQHLGDGDLVADVAVELLHAERITLLDPVLLAARLDHGVHRFSLETMAAFGCESGPDSRKAADLGDHLQAVKRPSGIQRPAKRLGDELRIALSFQLPHHLAHEEAEYRLLSRAVLLEFGGIRGDHAGHGLLDHAHVGDLLQPPGAHHRLGLLPGA